MTPTSTPKMGHVNIVAKDLDATADFFVTYLGFTKGKLTRVDADWVATLTGLPGAVAEFVPLSNPDVNVNIELLRYITPLPPERTTDVGQPNLGGFRHIGLLVDDIDAKYQELNSAGVRFLSPPQTISEMNLKTVYFIGPEGILLQLTQHL